MNNEFILGSKRSGEKKNHARMHRKIKLANSVKYWKTNISSLQ